MFVGLVVVILFGIYGVFEFWGREGFVLFGKWWLGYYCNLEFVVGICIFCIGV